MSTMFQIRDPVHGAIYVSAPERALIESPAFQRLRNIKQLGFADFAFPGASHSRYSHSLGAMNFAGLMFDRIFLELNVHKSQKACFRQALRLAALFHDIGHPPLSHTTEMLMPQKSSLFEQEELGQATHEDFTLKTILSSHLTSQINENFGVSMAPMVASLLSIENASDFFVVGNLDYAPLLRQIISSELDADRMDYLLRDSFFCGVNYGKFDSAWLIDNLISIDDETRVFLGIKARALFAFEDFLLSRYHMFLSVYLHHTPVIMEKMLGRFFTECPHEFCLPSNIENYLKLDDLDLWWALRKSSNPWAQRIVQRKPYVLLSEEFIRDSTISRTETLTQQLSQAGIDSITSRSKSILSKYFLANTSPLYVKESHKDPVKLQEFSSLFIRYQVPTQIDRVFISPEHLDEGYRILTSKQV